MPGIARGRSSDGTDPVLELFTPVDGILADAAEVAFQVMDISDATKRARPVQVFPTIPGARAHVDTTATWPAGDRLRTGHVVARWSPGEDEALGAHEVRWFVRPTPTAAERVVSLELDVLAAGAGSYRHGYASVSDLRDEGVTVADASDARLVRVIRLASQYVDRMTGRFFSPRPMTLTLDGSGGRMQPLGHPVIAVREVLMLLSMPVQVGDLAVSPTSYRIYNRHLAGLVDPDDREHPRLEFVHASDALGVRASPLASLGLGSLVWLWGVQNVVVDGLFGYTDADDTAVGRTPELIRHVTKLLVLRDLPGLADAVERDDRRNRWRIVSERTRDQSYDLDPLRTQGGFTGDPEIDAILASYQRPPHVGAV